MAVQRCRNKRCCNIDFLHDSIRSSADPFIQQKLVILTYTHTHHLKFLEGALRQTANEKTPICENLLKLDKKKTSRACGIWIKIFLPPSAAKNTGPPLSTDASPRAIFPRRAGHQYFISCLQLPVVEVKFQVRAANRGGGAPFYPGPIHETEILLGEPHYIFWSQLPLPWLIKWWFHPRRGQYRRTETTALFPPAAQQLKWVSLREECHCPHPQLQRHSGQKFCLWGEPDKNT